MAAILPAPLILTLYHGDEVGEVYIANFIPWRLFKLAMRLVELINQAPAAPTADDILTGLITELFEHAFTVGELRSGSTPAERMILLSEIVGRTRLLMAIHETQAEAEDAGSEYDWMSEMELSLMQKFGWPARVIDKTDIETLFPLVRRVTKMDGGGSQAEYCDQMAWL